MKTLWTLNIDNYLPGVTKLTYPFLEIYAEKIGAEFRIITERKFPEYSVTYEKLQIYELGKDNEINLFIDSDALIHPDLFDISSLLPRDTCFHVFNDFSPIRFRPSRAQIRDGRFLGACNWFVISTDRTHDLWKPLGISKHEMDNNIFPTKIEKDHGITEEHLEDDYALTMNIAEYSLRHLNYPEIQQQYPLLHPGSSFWFHEYLITGEEKEARIRETIKNWGF